MFKRVGCRMTLYNVGEAAKPRGILHVVLHGPHAWKFVGGIGLDASDDKPVPCRIVGS